MKKTAFLIPVLLSLLLFGCSPAELETLTENNSDFRISKGETAGGLSSEDFNSLSPEAQYQVANKLLGSIYKGVPLDQFFDLKKGMTNLRPTDSRFLETTRQQLKVRLENRDAYAKLINEKYRLDEDRRPIAETVAAMYELPISRDQFDIWMAYTLTNTILFSPAEEIDSASHIDVQKVHAGITRAMSEGANIRQIILTHMKSEANWRRFRSPEDNTREKIEIYHGLFDREEDVPKASKACKSWYLTDADDGYQLVIDLLNENTEPQQVLGEWVTSCDEFYELIARHELVIPRITTVLVDHFFPSTDSTTRAGIVQSIANSNPTHFEHVFLGILFSEAYLLDNERPKRFEETFFGTGDRLYWHANRNYFNDLVNPNPSSSFPTMTKMRQPAMRLKLGRWMEQPLDSLSFAVYHKGVRERLLINRTSDKLNTNDFGWTDEFLEGSLFIDESDYIDYLFLATLTRRATEEEKTALNAFIDEKGFSENRVRKTIIVLDYISRLPELYYFNAVATSTTASASESSN